MPKKKYNGFYYFMKEVQQNEKSRGNNISMANVPAIAHPIWKEMSLAQKEPYELKAKELKNDPGNYVKLASDGTKVEDNVREIEEAEKRERKMIRDVKSSCNVDCLSFEQFKENAPRKIFYMLSFNILCRTEDEVYIPNEVGLVEYSIQHGIHREYHSFFNAGFIPKGYTGEAMRHSEDKHQIPVYGHEKGEKNPKVILNDIKSFINPQNDEEYPPVFCSSKALELTQGCLHWLTIESGCHYDRDIFRVLNATYLLMELRAGVKEAYPSINFADGLLTKNAFDFHPSSRCDFHEELDTPHCALGYSKRLCFLISDAVCELFGITLTERHIPSRALEKKDYEIVLTTTKKHASYPASAGRGYGRGVPPSVAYSNASTISVHSGSIRDLDDFRDFPSLPAAKPIADDHYRAPAPRKPETTPDEPRQPSSLTQDLKRLGISTTTVIGQGGIGRGFPRS